MKIEIIPYEPIHAYSIIERNVREQDIWLSDYPDWEIWAQGWKDGGPAYTLFIDGEIVGCAGIVLLDWKRGEAWTLFSSLLYKYAGICIKVIQEKLEELVVEYDFKRVQALVNPDIEKAKKFMGHLGFQEEGLMRAFGPKNEDMIMFSRIYGRDE